MTEMRNRVREKKGALRCDTKTDLTMHCVYLIFVAIIIVIIRDKNWVWMRKAVCVATSLRQTSSSTCVWKSTTWKLKTYELNFRNKNYFLFILKTINWKLNMLTCAYNVFTRSKISMKSVERFWHLAIWKIYV